MKTAMQLMLEDFELRYKLLSDAQMIQGCATIEGTIEYAKSLIIKEKKQIIKAYQNGTCEPYAPLYKSEEYYNNLFNQTEDDENLKFY